MIIGIPQITQEGQRIIYQVSVQSSRGDEKLWYSIENSYKNLLSESSDAALVALLIPAMLIGEDIHIEGIISERLLHNISGPLQKLLQIIIPSLHLIKVNSDNVCLDRKLPASGVATGFSGGIDSYSVLADHYQTETNERFKVTHLLFNNVGSHGRKGEDLFKKRYEGLLAASKKLSLPFIMINSNLDSFFGKKVSFQKTHTLRNLSVALLLQKGIGHYLYASAYKYSDIFVGPTYGIAHIDTIILPLLSTDRLEATSSGSEYSRVEKTLAVAQIPDSHNFLDVCVNPKNTSDYTNCSTCWKCLRTLATLDIAGLLKHYSASFDLNRYNNKKHQYFIKLLKSNDPLLREIAQFAKARNYQFPLSSRILQALGFISFMKHSNQICYNIKRKLKNSSYTSKR